MGCGTTWVNEMSFGMDHAPKEVQSLDLLTCNPGQYHSAPWLPSTGYEKLSIDHELTMNANGPVNPQIITL